MTPGDAPPNGGVLPSVRVNLLWVLNGRLFQLVLSFVVSIVVARYLGPDRLGVLGFAIAFAGLFTPLGVIGGELVVRDLSTLDEGQQQGHVLGSAALVGGISGFVTFGISVAFAAVFLRSNPTLFVATVLMSTPLMLSPVRAIEFWFEARLQGRYLTLATGIAASVSAMARLLLIVGHAGIVAFALVLAAEQFLAAILTVIYYWRDRDRPRRWSFTRQQAISFVRQSAPLLVAGLAIAFYMKVDQVMLGVLSSEHQAGLYAAVSRLSEASYFIPVAIAASFAPGVARARATDAGLYSAQVDRLLTVLAAAGSAIAIPLALVSVPLTVILLGPAFSGAGPVLAVHALSAIFIYLGVGSTVWMTNERLQSLYMWRTLGGAVLNVGLNFVLIPWLGALGAAIATLVAYAFASVFSNGLNRRTRPLLVRQLRALRPVPMVRLGLTEGATILRSLRSARSR